MSWNNPNFWTMSTMVFLGYRDLYEDFDTTNLGDLLAGAPSIDILNSISFINAQIHHPNHVKFQEKLFEMFSGYVPKPEFNKAIRFIRDNKARGTYFGIVNNYSSCIIYRWVMENLNEQPEGSIIPAQEYNLFKAYLYANQIWIDRQYIPDFDFDSIDVYIRNILPIALPYNEFAVFKDFRYQYYRASEFFKFCLDDEDFERYLNLFLAENGLTRWEEYINQLISSYIRDLKPPRTTHRLKVTEEGVRTMLDNLAVNNRKILNEPDFLELRSYPIYKLSDDEYIFLNLNFFVDKVFNAIQFQFAQLLVSNNETYRGKLIKNAIQFFGILGQAFPERYLNHVLYSSLSENNDYVIYSEKDLIQRGWVEGTPDFYIRYKTKVFIVELKNVLMSAKVKHSNDFDIIQAHLKEKFVSDKNGKDEGVSQIVNSINSIKDGVMIDIDQFDTASATYYPIIVYTDFNHSLPGVNYNLNQELRQVAEERTEAPHKIKDLVLIHIDDLTHLMDCMRAKKVDFRRTINDYLSYVQSNSKKTRAVYYREGTTSFSYYLKGLEKAKPCFSLDAFIQKIEEILNG
ncbi:hypothetical protein [Roseivirga pacifica]|uniref:hypothetical protein n=1 Tax=Roseivirga pacifica TaxID=1267423 RepID=UPI00227B54DF|nr:hypothetical protein [Roseivirga pacifica]